MRGMWRAITTAGILSFTLLPMLAAVSPDAATSQRDPVPPTKMPVAIAQPLAAIDGSPLVTIPRKTGAEAVLPESGMLILVGTTLLGLAAAVRRHS